MPSKTFHCRATSGLGSSNVFPSDSAGESGQVVNFDGDVLLLLADPELEFAAGAEGQNRIGPDRGRFAEPAFADVMGDERILDERQDASATVRFLVMMGHFDEFDARDGLDDVPRGLINARDAADVAGVVPRHLLVDPAGKGERPGFDFFGDELAVMFGRDSDIRSRVLGAHSG